MLTTTARMLLKYHPCPSGIDTFKKQYPEYCKNDVDLNAPIPLTKIFESNGLMDTVWCLRAAPVSTYTLRSTLMHIILCVKMTTHMRRVFHEAVNSTDLNLVNLKVEALTRDKRCRSLHNQEIWRMIAAYANEDVSATMFFRACACAIHVVDQFQLENIILRLIKEL